MLAVWGQERRPGRHWILAAASQLAFAGTASATHAANSVQSAATSKFNLEDCSATLMIRLCTDPVGKSYNGHPGRFRDPITGAYVGHDEPSVKFISSQAGSGNTFTYGMRLSRDPARTPTASGSVTKYAELSIAPWFGLPMCDPNSYPQNPCTPLSDSNAGLGAPTDAGSAFMELQFYPPWFTPFVDSVSCIRTKWCAALTIDSLACTFNFATCNNNCIEPVNFATYSDPNVFQTCNGGQEGAGATGEGPCDPTTFICQNATTQGVNGPVACPSNNAASGALCEFSDANCFPRGNRPVVIDGTPARENAPVAYCNQEAFQNGHLDFDGTGYNAVWPNGSRNFPTSISYTGPTSRGQAYPDIQFETNVAASEALCNVATGAGCTAPPQGAAFYPFWSLTNRSASGACVWNFGNDIANVTTNDFGKTAQYGTPDVARFGGTFTSPVMANLSLAANCAAA